MSAWVDQATWQGLCSGQACPICVSGSPRDVAWELGASWVTMHEQAPARGYACLVSKVHAVEIHDLPEDMAALFWDDARRVSRALAGVTSAVKINYEIHGNTLPHLHMHFFPRYRGDRFEGRPIDPRSVVPPVYSPGEFADVKERLVHALLAA